MEFPFGYLVKFLTTTDIPFTLPSHSFLSQFHFSLLHIFWHHPLPRIHIFIRYTNPTSPLFKKVIRWFNLTQPLSSSFFFRGNYYSPSLRRNIHRSLSVLLPPYYGQEDPTPPSSSFICLPPSPPTSKKVSITVHGPWFPLPRASFVRILFRTRRHVAHIKKESPPVHTI